MPYQVLTRDEHFQNGGPKRILALDGGGLKGILTLGFLRRIETILRERYGNDENFRLCHYFDLIAGTSTGSIIAASLALGMGVEELIGHYDRLGREVFKKDLLRPGVIRSKYDEAKLIENLKVVLGANRTIGDPSLKTGLLVMTKRLDTGSPWPVGNNPRGRYFQAGATDNVAVVAIACVPPSGSTFLKGTNLVTCTATDAASNSVSCTFTVTILDTEPPVIGNTPDLLLTNAVGQCEALLCRSEGVRLFPEERLPDCQQAPRHLCATGIYSSTEHRWRSREGFPFR